MLKNKLLIALILTTLPYFFLSCKAKEVEPSITIEEAKSMIKNIDIELSDTSQPSISDKFKASYRISSRPTLKDFSNANIVLTTYDITHYNILKSFTVYINGSSDYYLHFYNTQHALKLGLPLRKDISLAVPILQNQGGMILNQNTNSDKAIIIKAGNIYTSNITLLGYLVIEDLKTPHRTIKYDVLLSPS